MNLKGQKRIRMVLVGLAFIMVLLTVSCGKSPGKESGTNTDNENGASGSLVDENGYLLDDLPDDLNYGGREFRIVYWNNAPADEFDSEEGSGSPIPESIWKRNEKVKSRLGVELIFKPQDGDNSAQKKFLSHLDTTVGQRMQEYDLIAAYSMCGGALSMRGYAADLNQTSYHNADMPWWPENLQLEATINNKLYFASGDISTNMLWSMFSVLFNKTLLAAYSAETDLYKMVDDGEWDLEAMMELSSLVYSDNDGVNGKSEGDLFGFTTYSVYCDAFFYGAGLKTTESTDDGLIISPTFGGEKTQELLRVLTDFFDTENAWFSVSSSGNQWSLKKYFAEGKSLFDLRPIYYIYQVINAKDAAGHVEFGVLPVPKYDETQSNYYTAVGFTYTLYSIPSDAKDPDCSSAVLEALASEAYRRTTPVLFDDTMKLRYSEDVEDSRMFDMIKNQVSFDLGRLFCSSFNLGSYENATYRMFRDAMIEGDSNWMSTYKGESKALEKALEKIISAFAGS